jgi:hypothetical protein
MVGRIQKPKEYNFDAMLKYTEKLFGIDTAIAKDRLCRSYDNVQEEFKRANMLVPDAAIWLVVRIGLDNAYAVKKLLQPNKFLREMERTIP